MSMDKKSRVKPLVVTLLIIIGMILTVKISHWVGLRSAYSELAEQSNHRLNRLISDTQRILGRFEKVPEVLSRHPLLTQVLQSPDDQGSQQQLNLLLEELRTVTQASEIYLINAAGMTVTASNWQSPESFIGKDFSFRPYFVEALDGDLGQYYAVGLSSDRRGYYYAYPVKTGPQVLGVIAVKISIDAIESQHHESFDDRDYHFLITTPDDVVFLSDRHQWRLKTLGKPTSQQQQQLATSKRYANREILALDVKQLPVIELPDQLNSNIYQVTTGGHKERFFSQQAQMANAGWQLHLWSSLDGIERHRAFLTTMSISSYLAVLLLILFAKERFRNIRQLRQARLLLEQRVEERTADLTASNLRLQAEISDREKAQQELKNTQDELVQSAKLAVIGSMSANINHEINQPLTALRSYGQNALAYLERGMTTKVKGNMEVMLDLVDRLADIVSQFKSFTKKSSGQPSPILVQENIAAALGIVKHQLQQERVQLQLNQPDDTLYTLGDSVRLEQVLINLLSNAIQAMSDQEYKTLHLELRTCGDDLCIIIRDNGPGILAGDIDKIFQPFFTTKESFGLGLGLSISQRIIESMQGQLSVQNHQTGGAEFIIRLPQHQLTQDL